MCPRCCAFWCSAVDIDTVVVDYNDELAMRMSNQSFKNVSRMHAGSKCPHCQQTLTPPPHPGRRDVCCPAVTGHTEMRECLSRLLAAVDSGGRVPRGSAFWRGGERCVI